MNRGIPCINVFETTRNIIGSGLGEAIRKKQKRDKELNEKRKQMRESFIDTLNKMSKKEAQSTFDYYNSMGAKNPPKSYYEASRLLRGMGNSGNQNLPGKSSKNESVTAGGDMSEKECEKKYNVILKRVIKEMGHDDITNNHELQEYCDKHIPKFTSVEGYDRMPQLKSGQSAIINLDDSKGPGSHWVAVFRLGRDLIVYDSFGRESKKILSKLKTGGLRVRDSDYDAEQGELQNSCGQRSVAWLIFCNKYGVDSALLI